MSEKTNLGRNTNMTFGTCHMCFLCHRLIAVDWPLIYLVIGNIIYFENIFSFVTEKITEAETAVGNPDAN